MYCTMKYDFDNYTFLRVTKIWYSYYHDIWNKLFIVTAEHYLISFHHSFVNGYYDTTFNCSRSMRNESCPLKCFTAKYFNIYIPWPCVQFGAVVINRVRVGLCKDVDLVVKLGKPSDMGWRLYPIKNKTTLWRTEQNTFL